MQIEELASALTKNSVSYLWKLRLDNTVCISNSRLPLASSKSCTRVLLHQKAMIFTHNHFNVVTYLQDHSCSLVSVIHTWVRKLPRSLTSTRAVSPLPPVRLAMVPEETLEGYAKRREKCTLWGKEIQYQNWDLLSFHLSNPFHICPEKQIKNYEFAFIYKYN